MAEEVRLLSERARREARMEDAITRARARLEAEERSSWARRAEQAALAVSTPPPVRTAAAAQDLCWLLHPVLSHAVVTLYCRLACGHDHCKAAAQPLNSVIGISQPASVPHGHNDVQSLC